MLVPKHLDFEVVTPTYVGGADASSRKADPDPDSKHKAEEKFEAEEKFLKRDARMRVRPIVDMWRYWFRALLGGLIGTDACARERIAEKETALFGGLGEPATAARVRVSLASGHTLRASNKYVVGPAGRNYGAYLGYGLGPRHSGRGEERVLEEHGRCAIEPSQPPFKVDVICGDDDWRLLEHVIRIWSLFGGLGARHRRGFGSIRWSNDGHGQVPRDHARLKTHLEGAVKRAREAFVERYCNRQWPTTPPPGDPPFDVVNPDHCVIRLVNQRFTGRQVSGQDEALTAIRHQLRTDPPGTPPFFLGANGVGWRQRTGAGRATLPATPKARGGFQFYDGRDHDAVHDARTRRSGGRVDNIALGAPIAYPTWDTTIRLLLKDGTELRRPSPLSFRVLKVPPDDFRVLVVLFKSDLFGAADVSAHVGDWTLGQRKPRNATYSDVGMCAPATAMSDLEDFVNKCDGDDLDFRGKP